ARMQFSPYRLQLAGIRTSPVLYQPLIYEITALGTVDASPRRAQGLAAAEVSVTTEVFEKDVPLLVEGQAVEATSDAFAGQEPFAGKVRALAAQLDTEAHTLTVWLDLNDPQRHLRPLMSLTVRIKVPATTFGALARAA